MIEPERRRKWAGCLARVQFQLLPQMQNPPEKHRYFAALMALITESAIRNMAWLRISSTLP